MSKQHLFLCSIGPVQSFIAAARRTQDLYVGSRLLSELMKSGAEAARDTVGDDNLLFPIPLGGEFFNEGVSHRMAFIASGDPQAVIKPIQAAIQGKWAAMYNDTGNWIIQELGIPDDNWTSVYQRQVENWLEFYWVAVPYQSDKHGAVYKQVGVALNSRKNLRHFPQMAEPGLKCTLTGAHSALSNGERVQDAHQWWEDFLNAFNRTYHYNPEANPVLKPTERLGAIATLKRFAQVAKLLSDDFEKFPSTTKIAIGDDDIKEGKVAYFAVLHMDGDSMGERLSALSTKEEHREISEALAEFATQTVPAIISKYDRQPGVAKLVYAGGDDVVAFLPTWAAISCAADIRAAFVADNRIGLFTNRKGEKASMSAGIAIVPHNLPLDTALEEARTAEKQAKNAYGRDAVVVRQYTGQIREMGLKWEAIPMIQALQSCFQLDLLSGKLGYDLLQMAYDLAGDQVPHEARRAEASRLFKRRTAQGVSEKDQQAIADLAVEFSDEAEKIEKEGWQSLAHWAILARFLVKKEDK